MGRRLTLVLETIIFLFLLVVVGALLFMYSGVYNVAATYPDNPAAEWFFSSMSDHSVQRHARNIKVPALDDPAQIRTGAGLYKEMCVACHGAPGVGIDKVAKALNPSPPELTEEAEEWKPNEFFWITKNGIRMTGMPAWQTSLSDNQIWAITAFAQKLNYMQPAEYKTLTSAPPAPKTR